MFNGVPHDQLHQFIAASSRAASSLPLPLSSSFPVHHHNHSQQTAAFSSNSFDISAYNSIPQHHQLLFPLQQQQHQQQFLHPILQQSPSSKSGINEPANPTLVDSDNNIDLEIERERTSHPHQPTSSTIDDPAWSNDEVLALLRIRSTMENWFPDFTWEHVSRKLSEIGFKRSGEKCKEKFEEESRYFNNNINNCTKTGRFLCSSSSELEEELYHQTQNQPARHQNHSTNTDVIRLVLENQTHESAGFQDNKGGTSTTTTTADQTACLEDDQLGSPRSYNHDHRQTFNGAAKVSELDRVEEKADAEYHDSSTGSKSKKRKRRQKVKFEMFKGFCGEIVSKMMCQQEEMHNKLLEDMVKRDKEKVEKEEAWKKEEMDRMNKELENMANEQAIAGDRQAIMIEFLNKFISSSGTTTTATSSGLSDQSQFSGPKSGKDSLDKVKSTNNHTEFSLTPLIQAAFESPRPKSPTSHHDLENQNNTNIVEELPSSSSTMIVRHENLSFSPENNVNEQSQQNPRAPSTTTSSSKNPSASSACLSAQKNPITSSNPTSSITHKVTLQNPISSINEIKEDVGKRWPRDEVLALINLRCSLYNSGADQDHHNKDKEGGSTSVKAPLWERISQGMAELGYKRSAKRCKEKWENINKYFRKTKDVNKKRSVDSRTCPYFHQLSTLYNKGTLVAPNNSEQGLQKINHHSSQLGSLANDHHDHQDDIDHHHHSPDVHVAAEGERSDDINIVVHHQEVVPAAFDFEF